MEKEHTVPRFVSVGTPLYRPFLPTPKWEATKKERHAMRVSLFCDKQTKSILRIRRIFRILQAVRVISSNYALNHSNLGNDVPQAIIPNHIRQRLICGFVNLSRLKAVRTGDTAMLPFRPNITMSI